MSFAENPIINSPFEKPEWHFELDAAGQPTGKKLPGRRNSVYVVPVAASRRRGPIQRELALFEEEDGTRDVLANFIDEGILVNAMNQDLRMADKLKATGAGNLFVATVPSIVKISIRCCRLLAAQGIAHLVFGIISIVFTFFDAGCTFSSVN